MIIRSVVVVKQCKCSKIAYVVNQAVSKHKAVAYLTSNDPVLLVEKSIVYVVSNYHLLHLEGEGQVNRFF